MDMQRIKRLATEWLQRRKLTEQFLIMFKPLAVRGNLTDDLKGQLSKLNLTLEESRRVKADRNIITQMYEAYRHNPFFNKLVDYFDDKPVEICRYTGPQGSTLSLQRRLGPHNPTLCIPGEDFNSDAMPAALTNSGSGVRDLIHVSDNPMGGARELAIWKLTPPEGIDLVIPERGIPIPLTPQALQRAVVYMSLWGELTPADRVEKIARLTEGMAAVLLAALRAKGVSLSDFEVVTTAEGARIIWFLPDKALVNPVHMMPGETAIYAGRSGGARGANLGWSLLEVVDRLLKISNLT